MDYVMSFFQNTLVAYILTFFVGFLAGVITFATDFTDKPKILIKSCWCLTYSIFSGLMALISFELLRLIDVKVMSLSLNDSPLIFAMIIGLCWYKILDTLDSLDVTNNTRLRGFLDLFLKIKKYLYYHYTINQMEKIRKDVFEVVKNIDDSVFYDFSLKCIRMAKGIDSEKGEMLAISYSEYKEKNVKISDYKTEISIEIAKIVGINLLKQAYEEITHFPDISADIEKLQGQLVELDNINRSKEDIHD